MMKLVLLGCGGFHPNDRRHTACLMLPEAGIVLDAGTATYRVRDHIATDELDFFITHTHLDHVIGLTFLHNVLYKRNVKRVTVHAMADKIEAIREHLLHKALFPVMPPCEFSPLDGPVDLRDGGKLSHFPVEHPGGAVAFRLDWPMRSMAYVTDTFASADADYVEKIRGVDLLVHECFLPDEHGDWAKTTGHSTTSPVCELARDAKVGRLVLVHLNALAGDKDPVDLNVARAIFPATAVGHDLMEIDF